ncbi:MAG: dockerin type I repeat-containing protein [Clostridia bacterium]|nr:dockerin type I repeat-containing protein [Clostridia bacterium]
MKKQTRNKSICMLIVLAVFIGMFSFPSFAVEKGDIDADGSITAGDARVALRYSVGLEELSEDERFIADMDSDGAVYSADARTILRIAVGLEPSIFISNQYDMLRSGIYNYMGERLDTETGQYEYFELARTRNTVHLLLTFEGVEIAMFMQDGNIYAVSHNKKMYLVTPEEVFDTLGIDKKTLIEKYKTDGVSYPDLSKAQSVKDGQVDGFQCKIYRITENGITTEVSMCGGKLIRLREYNKQNKLIGETKFYSVSMSIPAQKKAIPEGYKKYEGKLQAISFVSELLK